MVPRKYLKKSIALVLLCSTVFATTPVSAADIHKPKATLGSVNGVGPVSLRGMQIAQEGTLFDRDEVEVGAKGYAKVTLIGGHKLELDQTTKVNIRQSGDKVVVQIGSGNIGFTSAKDSELTLVAGPYVVTVNHASGNLAMIGSGAVGIRTLTGKVGVRQTTTKASFVVMEGHERILSYDGRMTTSLAEIASNVPESLPAVPPLPQPQTAGSGRSISTAGWIAIIATIGGAAGAFSIFSTPLSS